MIESIELVIERCMKIGERSASAADVLRLYLELPYVVPYPNGVRGVKHRSSFEAIFEDAATASGWLSTLGFLSFFDQIGKVLCRTGGPSLPAELNRMERALAKFGDCTELSEGDWAALYALRCALMHDYSLIKSARHEGRRESRAPAT